MRGFADSRSSSGAVGTWNLELGAWRFPPLHVSGTGSSEGRGIRVTRYAYASPGPAPAIVHRSSVLRWESRSDAGVAWLSTGMSARALVLGGPLSSRASARPTCEQ